MKKILVLLIIAFNLSAAVLSVPTQMKEFSNVDKYHYKWLATNTEAILSISSRFDTEKFMSEESLKRQLKLMLRNYYKDLNLNGKTGSTFIKLSVELLKYNDKLDIYYGLIQLKVSPPFDEPKGSKDYSYTMQIACHESQCKQFIKDDITTMIEKFVDDTYYMQDLMKNKK